MPGRQPPRCLLPSPRQHCRRWRRCQRTTESQGFDMSNAGIASIPSLVTHNQGDLASRGSGSNGVAGNTRYLQTRCPSARSGWASIGICQAVKAGEKIDGANQQVSDTSTPSRVCQCVRGGRDHFRQDWMKRAQDWLSKRTDIHPPSRELHLATSTSQRLRAAKLTTTQARKASLCGRASIWRYHCSRPSAPCR
jgi:hypothetical protein